MSAHFMLEHFLAIALRVTVLLAIAAVVDLGLHRAASATVRHMVWSLAVIGALALPLLRTALPAVRLPILPATTTAPVAPIISAPLPEPSAQRRNAPSARYESAPSTEPTAAIEDRSASATARPSWSDVLFLGYLSGALVVLLGIGIDHLRLRRLTRRASAVDDQQWTVLLRRLSDRSGVRRRVQLLKSVDAVVPFTSGMARPLIVLPIAAEGWSTDQREAVLLHELAHVARRDCLTQLLAAVACALYWPHPLIWRAGARLRVEREHACDDHVLARGVSPSGYGRQLLTIARAVGSPMPKLAVSMATTRDLEARLRAVIDESRRRDELGRPKALMVWGAALLLVAVVATGSA